MEDIQTHCEKLFEYLRCILFEELYIDLETPEFPKEFEKLCQGLNMLSVWMGEYKQFADSLASGDLNTTAPDSDNPIVWPIKALRSNLLQLTWQTQQIASGNYNQQVDFFGDFSLSFNKMIQQLSERDKEINSQMENAVQREQALAQSNEVLAKITEYMDDMIVIYDNIDNHVVFENASASRFRSSHAKEAMELISNSLLRDRDSTSGDDCFEIEIKDSEIKSKLMIFQVSRYPMLWKQHSANLYLIKNLTASRSKTQYMEKLAFTDALTSLYNRHYFIVTLKKWLDENPLFSVCFIDLDGLKTVNDSLGHAEGDNYLKSMAHLLKHSFRQDDMQFRIGGDEFVVLMNDVQTEKATERMEYIHDTFLKMSTNYPKSISYGILEVNNNEDDLDVDQIMEIVDERMYKDKNSKKAMRK